MKMNTLFFIFSLFISGVFCSSAIAMNSGQQTVNAQILPVPAMPLAERITLFTGMFTNISNDQGFEVAMQFATYVFSVDSELAMAFLVALDSVL